jgi:hypothetical protein
MLPQNGKFQVIPIEEIELDKENPRIRKFLEHYGDNITPEAMHLALGAGGNTADNPAGSTTYQSLSESIRINQGIINPILVNKNPEGKFIVIEGNTRLQIYITLKEENAPGDWDKIPAIVYDDLSNKGKDAIRLQAHLVGPRPWDPYSKAKYLNELRHVQHMTWNEIGEFCGGNIRQINNYVDAYEDMEKYYREVIPDDSSFDTSRFSAFVELQKPSIKEAIITHKFSLKDFALWVHERKIDPLNTVRQLPRILNNEESKKVFLNHGQGAAKEAIKILNVPTTTSTTLHDATLEILMSALTEKLGILPGREVAQLRENPDSSRGQIFNDLYDEIQWIYNEINANN